jgi:hypothetical protein
MGKIIYASELPKWKEKKFYPPVPEDLDTAVVPKNWTM